MKKLMIFTTLFLALDIWSMEKDDQKSKPQTNISQKIKKLSQAGQLEEKVKNLDATKLCNQSSINSINKLSQLEQSLTIVSEDSNNYDESIEILLEQFKPSIEHFENLDILQAIEKFVKAVELLKKEFNDKNINTNSCNNAVTNIINGYKEILAKEYADQFLGLDELTLNVLLEKEIGEVYHRRSKNLKDAIPIAKLIMAGANPNILPKPGKSSLGIYGVVEYEIPCLLVVASENEYSSFFINFLSFYNINFNLIGRGGWTPLMHCIAERNKEFLETFIQFGARTNRLFSIKHGNRSIKGTPLMIASFSGHQEMVKILLGCSDVCVNSNNAEGDTALSLAFEGLLKAISPSWNSNGRIPYTPFDLSKFEAFCQIIEMLLDKGSTFKLDYEASALKLDKYFTQINRDCTEVLEILLPKEEILKRIFNI